ncbi:hypothetical protein ACIQ7Q_26025 [Streptomyces sp. NPDC096176]|uniref:hypothetical protein n=1 Tax=Streptomyces sp. NPDC096176 TaxID=3366079 RepID=UPI0038228537
MTARRAGAVDQIVFRWDGANPLGNTGFGPVAWSGERSEVARLFRPISHLLRSAGRDTSPALVRLVSDDSPTAMLVHRRPWRGHGGRQDTLCHALYGPEESLDAETCLGLYDWNWEGSGIPVGEVRGALDPVPLAALGESALAGGRQLAGRLAHAAPELTAVAAEVLRNPGGLYTVLDRMGDDGPCCLLWGLYGIFSRALPRAWTFATHDTADSRQLGFMFVSRWPSSPDQDGPRVRTDPWEPPDDRPREVAEQLVRGYLRAVARGDAHEFELADALLAALSHPGAARDGRMLVAAAEDALASLERRAPRERRAHPVQPEGERHERGRPMAERHEPGRPVSERAPVDELFGGPSASSSLSSYGSSRGSSFDPQPQPFPAARAETPAPPTMPPPPPPPTTGAPRAEALPVVRPTWPEPSGVRRRLPVLGRKPAALGADVLAARLQACRDEREEADVLGDAGDTDLLRVLVSEPSYTALTLIVRRIADRWPDWPPAERRQLCRAVLRQDLLLARRAPQAPGDPDEPVRAANAAALYRWAVRPFAAEPDVGEQLAELLPRMYRGDDRVKLATAEQILTGRDDPGITFQVWQELLRRSPASSGRLQAPPEQPPPTQSASRMPGRQDPRPLEPQRQEPERHPSERHGSPRNAPEPRRHGPEPGRQVHRDPEPPPAPTSQPQTRTRYAPDDPERSRRAPRQPAGAPGHASQGAAGHGRNFLFALAGFGVLVITLLVWIVARS